VVVIVFLRLIWPEKDRDRRRPPKLQTDDSPSSAINGGRDHRHQNPRPQIYQKQPFFWLEISPENFTASNSNRAWATRAASGIFVNLGEIQGYFIILPIQWHSGNFSRFLLVFLIFFIYKCL